MTEFGKPPWRVETTESGSAFLVCGDDEVPGFAEYCNEPEMLAYRIDRLRRIAACINACAGIPIADLERASRFMPTLAAPLTAKQKAELLSKLETARPSEVIAIPGGMEHRPARLVWRKDPPDKPGWWFWKKSEDGEPFVLEVKQRGGGGLEVVWWSGDKELNDPFLAGSLWAGPIEPPEAPNA